MQLKDYLPLLLVLLLGMSSCVSNKNIVYLQDKGQNQGHKKMKESTVKSSTVDYVLQTNDVISVRINHLQLTEEFKQVSEEFDTQTRMGIQHPMLTGYTINDEGYIDLPTLGPIHVAGLKLFEAEKKITTQAEQFYTNYSVKVFLLNYYVSILGEVNRPGRYPVFVNEFNIFEALGMAGDATEYADRSSVRVIRGRGENNQVFVLDLNDDDILGKQAFYLQPNDIIMVNPLKKKKLIRRDPQNLFNAVSTIVSVVTLYLLITK